MPGDLPNEVDAVPEPNRRWVKVGVELEGGWNMSRARLESLVGGRGLVHEDGSVRISDFGDDEGEECDYCCYGLDEDRGATECTCAGEDAGTYSGEVSSRPYLRWSSLEAFIRRCHPNVTNNTCGFHIHASFSVADMGLLMEREFATYFDAAWRAWGIERGLASNHEFYIRLRGDNQYCRSDFIPDRQISEGESTTRYTQLNFAAYSRHGTLECRLLPMFQDVELTVAAARKLLDIYNAYLTNCRVLQDSFSVVIEPSTSDEPILINIEGEADDEAAISFSIDSEAEETDLATLRSGDTIVHRSMSGPQLQEALADFIWTTGPRFLQQLRQESDTTCA